MARVSLTPIPKASRPLEVRTAAPPRNRSRARPSRPSSPTPTTFRVTTALSSPDGYGCAAALLWLGVHAAPGFSLECPGYALGHQAMTCEDVPGVCPARKLIVIADPCPAAYMNEAHNSWVAEGLVSGPIDPYGACP